MTDILGADLEVLAMKAYQYYPKREMEKTIMLTLNC